MHFLNLAAAFAFLVLGLITPTSAHHSSDLHCPEGSRPGFVHNSYTYNGPFHEFASIMKSFFHIQWYGGTIVNATSGTDNVPGATRAGPYAQGSFNETLWEYCHHSDMLEYTYHGAPATWEPPLHFAGYVETMRLESICSGKATYIDILTYTCSNHQTAAYTLWYNLHMSTFKELADSLGATVMAGDCPLSYS